ncbi:uncharacterized protein LOC142977959 [Anticarsia gemmatalis]|uniref:uncharacterized protein LOC142977959 n=1 Tax=Anticarsia gemmatalis TaxID=129554 RepID=UPI003F759AFB
MAIHLRVILLLFTGVIFAKINATNSLFEIDDARTDNSIVYDVTPRTPDVIALYKKVIPDGPSIDLLIKNSPTLQIIMEKAKSRSSKLEMRLLQWTDFLSTLSLIDKQLHRSVMNHNNLEEDTLTNYAEWVVSLDSGAPAGILEKIHNLIVPLFKNEGLIEIVHSFLQQDLESDVCDLKMSAHQIILDVYNTIMQTEIKSYSLLRYSWQLLRQFERGSFKMEEALVRERYNTRAAEVAASARTALAKAKRELYKCSPSSYNSDTYAEVTRLLQGYIENEVDMNSDGTCRKDCPYYKSAWNHGCSYDSEYCSKQPKCGGEIIDCKFFKSDMWVCPASYYSNRRYEFIQYVNGGTLGQSGYCSLGTTKVESWHRWFVHCSYCLCICDDASDRSHRYFSLRPVLADTSKNKVVTGVRLQKQGRVFYLQINQGTLGPRGHVGPSELVPLSTFDPKNIGVYEGTDYHKLSNAKRAIDLDKLESPAGYVLTGIRFQTYSKHLYISIQSTPFDYETGKLDTSKSKWITTPNFPSSRLNLYSPDLPTRGNNKYDIDSSHSQYVEFTHSDYGKDAAQTTVPFIDIQNVVSGKAYENSQNLNSGVGLYHRGRWGTGGFIGIKLFTYDYSSHIKAEPLPEYLVADEELTTESYHIEAN